MRSAIGISRSHEHNGEKVFVVVIFRAGTLGIPKDNMFAIKCFASIGDVPPPFKHLSCGLTFFRVVLDMDGLFTVLFLLALARKTSGLRGIVKMAFRN